MPPRAGRPELRRSAQGPRHDRRPGSGTPRWASYASLAITSSVKRFMASIFTSTGELNR
jgi:hypothetical protein